MPREEFRRQVRLAPTRRWQVAPQGTSLGVTLGAAVGSLVFPSLALAGPTERAADYLVARQDQTSGGFSSGDPADAPVAAAYSDWAALAIVASREDPRDIGSGATLRRAVTDGATAAGSTASLSRSTQAVAAIGANPRSLRGRNLVADLRARQGADGTFEGDVLETAWAVLALRASAVLSGDATLDSAAQAILRLQKADGGWGAQGGESDPAVTAAAIQALVASGIPSRGDALGRARNWLVGRQTASGGIRPAGVGRADALTTAWTLLAVAALGDVPGLAPWDRGGGPKAYLLGLQRPDGSFAYRPGQRAAPNWITSIAAVAVARRFLPMKATSTPRRVDHRPTVIGRTPAAGSPFEGRLIVRVRDDLGGSGVDPTAVRLRVRGRDVTGRARITPYAIEVDGLPTSADTPTSVQLDLADRAGNRRQLAWTLGPNTP